MWWRFRRHRLALVSAIVLLGFYLATLFAPFLAIHHPTDSEAERTLMPPQKIHWLDGGRFRPHVFAVEGTRDPRTFKRVYTEDRSRKYPLRLFARGFPYKLLWLFPTDLHLLGTAAPAAPAAPTLFLFGTDLQGRDLYSRLVFGTRVSMSIGLVGVTLSLFLGILLGGISGFYGGAVDGVIQRAIEIIYSIPAIPFWMGLAAFLPRHWSVLQVYFAITIIISVLGWTGLARVVRGRFLALRDEDFVTAAQLSGASRTKTIFRYMLPSFYSHIIAEITLSIPQMIISETALSFLGLGIRPPAVSYGTLLQAAQNVQTVALTPWLMIPAIPVTVAVLAFNFLGDGVRDAADPYTQHAAARGRSKDRGRRRPPRVTAAPPPAAAPAAAGPPPLLSVRRLHTHFPLDEGTVVAVDGASFDVPAGKSLGIVGESGCGKSVTARSVLRILDRPGEIVGGQILFRRAAGNGHGELLDLAALDADGEQMRAIRGGEIAMVFQEPMASFSPLHTVSVQLTEAIRLHRRGAGKAEARAIAIEALRQVGVPNPEQRVDSYAFELSGGLRQRAMIAIALSCRPSLLIADEPTTALDVTTQAQILDLIRELQRQHGMAIMLITHDMGVIAELADEVAVMYLGRVVESAPVDAIFHDPKHPYTQALHRSIPSITAPTGQPLDSIAGSVPHPGERPRGCPFHPRCPSFMPDVCDRAAPELLPVAPGHGASCFLHEHTPRGAP